MVAITTGILGALLYGTASQALGSVADARHGHRVGAGRRARRASSRSRAGARGRARSSSPRPTCPSCSARRCARRALAARPLARGLCAGAGVAAVVAGVALVGLAGEGRGIDAGPRGRARGRRGPARRPRRGRRRARAVLGALGAGDRPRAARLARPRRRARRRGAARARPGAGSCCGRGRGAGRCSPCPARTAASLLALGAAGGRDRPLAVAAAARGFEPCPTERHAVRAEARSGADGVGVGARRAHRPPVAAARRRDPRAGARHAACARRATPSWRSRGATRRRRCARPSARSAAPRWRRGAAAVAIAAADRPAAAAVAALGSYVAASTLLEPLRVEIDRPSASRVLLRRPFGRILLGHVAVPIAVMAAGAAVAGHRPGRRRRAAGPRRRARGRGDRGRPHHRPVRRAVLAPRRPRAGERPRHGHRPAIRPAAGIVVAWLLAWPAAAVVLGALPLVYVARGTSLSSAAGLRLRGRARRAVRPRRRARQLGGLSVADDTCVTRGRSARRPEPAPGARRPRRPAPRGGG